MEIVIAEDCRYIDDIVEIHLKTFEGFFLTFLGKGFLKQLYSGFIKYDKSNIIIARDCNQIVGFLAYSEDMSSFYNYLIKERLFQFAWYGFLGFIKKPTILFRLLSAFGKSEEVVRKEKYIELASIGVSPTYKGKGVGTQMIDYLKQTIDFAEFSYILLETDAKNNEYANKFYKKNGFAKSRNYVTKQGREMNEYQYKRRKINE